MGLGRVGKDRWGQDSVTEETYTNSEEPKGSVD